MVKQLSNCLFQWFSNIKSSAVIRGKDRLTLTLHVVLYETVTTSVAEKYLGSIQTEGKCGPNPILLPICNLYSRQGTAVWTNRSHLSDFTSLKCDKQFCLWGGGANRFRPIGMIMPCWEAAAYGKMFFLSFKNLFFSPKLFLKIIWLALTSIVENSFFSATLTLRWNAEIPKNRFLNNIFLNCALRPD